MTRVASGMMPETKFPESGRIGHGTQVTNVFTTLSKGTQEEQQSRSFSRLIEVAMSNGDGDALNAVQLRAQHIKEEAAKAARENMEKLRYYNSALYHQQLMATLQQRIDDANRRIAALRAAALAAAALRPAPVYHATWHAILHWKAPANPWESGYYYYTYVYY